MTFFLIAFGVVGLLVLIALPAATTRRVALNMMWGALLLYPGAYAVLSGRASYGTDSPTREALGPLSNAFHALIVCACMLILAGSRRSNRDEGLAALRRAVLTYLMTQALVIVVHASWFAVTGWLVVALVLGVMLLAPESAAKTEARVRWGLRLYVAASLVALIANPEWALVPEESTSRALFGFRERLVGFTSSSNYLGLISAILFALEMPAILRRRGTAIGWASVALGACALSQSRTPLIAIAMVIVLAAGYAVGLLKRDRPRSSALLVALTVASLIPLVFLIYAPLSARQVVNDITTGRVTIWETALSEFVASPVIGRGHSLFSQTYWENSSVQGFYSNAHNQMLESAARGGLLELLGLAIFLFGVLEMVKRSWPTEHGLTVLLLAVVMFSQLIVGTPLRTAGITWNLVQLAALLGIGAASLAEATGGINANTPQGVRGRRSGVRQL